MNQVTNITPEELELRSYEPFDKGWFNQRKGKEVVIRADGVDWVGVIVGVSGPNWYRQVVELETVASYLPPKAYILLKDISAVAEGS